MCSDSRGAGRLRGSIVNFLRLDLFLPDASSTIFAHLQTSVPVMRSTDDSVPASVPSSAFSLTIIPASRRPTSRLTSSRLVPSPSPSSTSHHQLPSLALIYVFVQLRFPGNLSMIVSLCPLLSLSVASVALLPFLDAPLQLPTHSSSPRSGPSATVLSSLSYRKQRRATKRRKQQKQRLRPTSDLRCFASSPSSFLPFLPSLTTPTFLLFPSLIPSFRHEDHPPPPPHTHDPVHPSWSGQMGGSSVLLPVPSPRPRLALLTPPPSLSSFALDRRFLHPPSPPLSRPDDCLQELVPHVSPQPREGSQLHKVADVVVVFRKQTSSIVDGR